VILAGTGNEQQAFRGAERETIGYQVPIITPPEWRGKDIPDREKERVVRGMEELFQSITNTAPVMIWMSGPDKLCTYFNQTKLQFTGQSLNSELGNGWTKGIHRNDLKRCLETYTKAFDLRQYFHVEYRHRRYDGEYRWILSSGAPRFNPDGSFAGYIGSAIDVTELKLAEESVSRVSQTLIHGQEEDRVRTARELNHFIDSLTILSIHLDLFRQNPPESATEVLQRIGEARRQIKVIVNDIRTLSHRLHSSKPEYLGLAAAAACFCKELSDAQKVTIDFHNKDVPNEVPREVSLCLYHVLQEALHNAIKHSGSPRFEVSLDGKPNEIQLTVRDWGIGFDPLVALKKRGLGLTSMKGRMKLVGGKLSIESQSQHGTTIHARVPLKGQANLIPTTE
jgi:PAS domain S-box-containing protein